MLGGFVAATLAAELMSVFSNAIMTGLVPKAELGRLSGNGWAVGYFGGLASLALVAGFLVPMPGEAKTLLGFDPLLHLDTRRASSRPHHRAVCRDLVCDLHHSFFSVRPRPARSSAARPSEAIGGG